MGFAGSSINLYVYASNDPVNLNDPLGLCEGESGDDIVRAVHQLNASVADAMELAIVSFAGIGAGVGFTLSQAEDDAMRMASQWYMETGSPQLAGSMGHYTGLGARWSGPDKILPRVLIEWKFCFDPRGIESARCLRAAREGLEQVAGYAKQYPGRRTIVKVFNPITHQARLWRGP